MRVGQRGGGGLLGRSYWKGEVLGIGLMLVGYEYTYVIERSFFYRSQFS